jgi:hypothetical protein
LTTDMKVYPVLPEEEISKLMLAVVVKREKKQLLDP